MMNDVRRLSEMNAASVFTLHKYLNGIPHALNEINANNGFSDFYHFPWVYYTQKNISMRHGKKSFFS